MTSHNYEVITSWWELSNYSHYDGSYCRCLQFNYSVLLFPFTMKRLLGQNNNFFSLIWETSYTDHGIDGRLFPHRHQTPPFSLWPIFIAVTWVSHGTKLVVYSYIKYHPARWRAHHRFKTILYNFFKQIVLNFTNISRENICIIHRLTKIISCHLSKLLVAAYKVEPHWVNTSVFRRILF